MINDSVGVRSNSSFLKKQLFKLKINEALKFCEKIKERVKASHKLGHEDFYINLVVADPEKETIEERYFAIKGYDEDGRLMPLQVYTMENEELKQVDKSDDTNIIVLDLYEKSIYLHNYKVEGNYAEGYLVRMENFKNGYNLILSAEKVSVFMKNTNTYEKYNSIIEFVDKYLL